MNGWVKAELRRTRPVRSSSSSNKRLPCLRSLCQTTCLQATQRRGWRCSTEVLAPLLAPQPLLPPPNRNLLYPPLIDDKTGERAARAADGVSGGQVNSPRVSLFLWWTVNIIKRKTTRKAAKLLVGAVQLKALGDFRSPTVGSIRVRRWENKRQGSMTAVGRGSSYSSGTETPKRWLLASAFWAKAQNSRGFASCPIKSAR